MIHSSLRSTSAWAFANSSSGTCSPPTRNWIRSSGCRGSPVRPASLFASVDFPPPALPKTATLFTLVRGLGELYAVDHHLPASLILERRLADDEGRAHRPD